MSILNKIRVLTLGAIHDLLDKRIDDNSPSAIRQYIRDLEAGRDHLTTESTIASGALRTLKRQRDQQERKLDDLTNRTKLALTRPDNPAESLLARNNAQIILTLKSSIENANKSIETQEATCRQMEQAVVGVNAKHDYMVERLHQLEMLDGQTKAKEQAAAAIGHVQSVLSSIGEGGSVDNLEDKMRARGDIADAQFDRAMVSFVDATSPQNSDEVNQLLESLKPATPELAAKS